MVDNKVRKISWKASVSVFLLTVMLFFANMAIAGDTGEQIDGNGVFPAFGDGPVEVRLYANYFCGPCRALEPEVEPVLHELIEKGKIRLILVDVPMFQAMPYIHNFLYALNAEPSIENAFKVRNVLFDVASRGGGPEGIAESFEKEGIATDPFDLTEVFTRFNTMLKEDEVRSTPSAAIHSNGSVEMHSGRNNILAALGKIE